MYIGCMCACARGNVIQGEGEGEGEAEAEAEGESEGHVRPSSYLARTALRSPLAETRWLRLLSHL